MKTKLIISTLCALIYFSHFSRAQTVEAIISTGTSVSTIYNHINTDFTNNRGTLIILGDVTIDSNLEIPKETVLEIRNGGSLNILAGVELEINGSIEAGLYQIFDGDGIISGTPQIEYLYPQWFGGVANLPSSASNTAQTTAALQRTINTAVDLSIPVKLPVGIYKVSELYVNSNGKPFKMVGDLIDKSDQVLGSTLWLANLGSNGILLHLGFDGTNESECTNFHIEGINFKTEFSRSNETYAIKGGDYTNPSNTVSRGTIEKCTFTEFLYGIYLGGYSDGMYLGNLKFETVNRCIYIAKGDGTRISNIVAEPYVEYVLHAVNCMGLVFSDAILRGPRGLFDPNNANYSTAFIIPFIIRGGVHNVGGGVEVKNIHIEGSNGVAKIADAPRIQFDNVYFQLIDSENDNIYMEQQHHTIELLSRDVQPIQCQFRNFTFVRDHDQKEGKVDILVKEYTNLGNPFDKSSNLIEANTPNYYRNCMPEGLVVENWNIDPTSDAFDRVEDGVFKFTINGITHGDYSFTNLVDVPYASQQYQVPQFGTGISELTGLLKVKGGGLGAPPKRIKLISTFTPWEGEIKILMYKSTDENASRSCTYNVSGALNNNNYEAGTENFSYRSGTPVFHGIINGYDPYNKSIDFEFEGDLNEEYKLVFYYKSISKLK